MRLRPLAIVLALVVVDYALWDWSLAGSRAVTAVISGLTLPPLLAALVWLVALNLLRAVGRATRRNPATPARNSALASSQRPRRRLRPRARVYTGASARAGAPVTDARPAGTSAGAAKSSSSRKIAA